MLPILTPAEASALDRASEEAGVPVSVLMEAAGAAVARAATVAAGGAYARRGVVVCGKGNNGGDGLVAARLLERAGMGVTAVLLEDPGAFAGPARAAFERFAGGGGRWVGSGALPRELARADVAVDAVFGTGFRGTPQGAYDTALRSLDGAGPPVVSVDIPSGVEGESGAIRGPAVRAGVTVVLGALKPGIVFEPGAERAGRIEVADIGFPPGLVRSELLLVEGADARTWLPPRSPDANKRSTGVVVVLAGSRDMSGAAALAAAAAYRAGAGLVTVASTPAVIDAVRQEVPEATFLPLPETDTGAADAAGWEALRERLPGADAVAAGPGLGRHAATGDLVRRVVRESPVPVVLDADGLYAFGGDASAVADRASEAILTPHAGEFARLMDVSADDVRDDRVGLSRKAAQEVRATVLLKGPRTLVATPEGRVYVNPTGGPALATAGSGDVLTGTIAALLARGLAPQYAAAAGAFVHGAAGDLAAELTGEGTVAGDVAALLPDAVAAIRAADDG
jgi:ADP-dependent NAD(P)H-hydrate dehydratase / NAD(P)H-hydrate epimerase